VPKPMSPRLVGLLALPLWLLACGGGGSEDCADGYYLWQGQCVPRVTGDISGGDWQPPKPDTAEPQPEPTPEEVAVEVVEADAEAIEEVIESDFVATGQVGSPCTSPNDCDPGLTCLGGWPGGSCTITGCDPATKPCPEGAACVALADGFRACVATCTDHAQCRTGEGYRCKTLDDGSGTPVRFCHATDEDAAGLGGPCERTEECAGPLACLLGFPYGYCGQLFCDEVPCEAGACVRLNGVPTCLKGCGTADDCRYDDKDWDLVCQSVRAVDNTQVKVCLGDVEAKGLGETCASDFECDASAGLGCHLLARGRCALGDEPCRTDAECPRANDFCLMGESAPVGMCTKGCDGSSKCPGTAQCLNETGTTGTCSPACFSANLCPGGGVMDCVYGDPLVSSTGSGVSACAIVYLGSPGAPCRATSECAGGATCLTGLTPQGYCLAPCPAGILTSCPFPTTCATHKLQKGCYLRCDPSADDCPAGFTCDTPSGAPPVCLPSE